MPRTPWLILLAAAAAWLLAPARAAGEATTLQIDIHGESGTSIRLDLPLDRLADFVPGARATLDCDGSGDRETREMMAYLEQAGEGGTYRIAGHDGDAVARRRGGQLTIDKTDDDGERAHVEMPWLLAECFFGGRPVQAEVRELFRHGHRVLVDIRGEDGGQVRVSVD